MKTTYVTLALAASIAMASASAQAANVSVEGDGNQTTVIENHYHIKNEYNVRRGYDDRSYATRYGYRSEYDDPAYNREYYRYYRSPQPYAVVRPMLPAPMPFFFRYGMRGFYR